MREVPSMYRSIFEKAATGRRPKAAIKAFCLACVGFVRKDITNCSATQCPLYPYRPYQAGQEDEPSGGMDALADETNAAARDYEQAALRG